MTQYQYVCGSSMHGRLTISTSHVEDLEVRFLQIDRRKDDFPVETLLNPDMLLPETLQLAARSAEEVRRVLVSRVVGHVESVLSNLVREDGLSLAFFTTKTSDEPRMMGIRYILAVCCVIKCLREIVSEMRSFAVSTHESGQLWFRLNDDGIWH